MVGLVRVIDAGGSTWVYVARRPQLSGQRTQRLKLTLLYTKLTHTQRLTSPYPYHRQPWLNPPMACVVWFWFCMWEFVFWVDFGVCVFMEMMGFYGFQQKMNFLGREKSFEILFFPLKSRELPLLDVLLHLLNLSPHCITCYFGLIWILLLYTGRKWIYEITTWSLGHNKKPVSDQKLMGELGCWCSEKKKKRILKKEEGVENRLWRGYLLSFRFYACHVSCIHLKMGENRRGGNWRWAGSQNMCVWV